MRKSIDIPDNILEKLQSTRKEYFPHLTLGQMLVQWSLEKMAEIKRKELK